MTIGVDISVDGFTWTSESWGRGLRADALSPVALHVFTTRDLPLGANEGPWTEIARALGTTHLVRLRQVHGADVVVLRRGEPHRARRERERADILVSNDPFVTIAVQAADCVPLLLADPVTGAVAAAHAGWRGLAARVPEHAVLALADAFGARASDLIVAIGPSIGPCCYEVGPELDEAFATAGFEDHARRRWFAAREVKRKGRLSLDLWVAVVDQLVAAGVPVAQISIARLCTAHQPRLFPSYRRDRETAGRLAGAIRSADSNRD